MEPGKRESTGIGIPLESGEPVRLRLASLGFLDSGLKPVKENELLILPLLESIDRKHLQEELDNLGEDLSVEFQFLRTWFHPNDRIPRHYKEILAESENIPGELLPLLPTSYDLIGRVIVIKVNKELEPFLEEIGKALMKVHHNYRAVAVDRGVQGDFRIRKLEAIAGDRVLRTIHTELGMKLKMDLEKMYFSPRLSRERQRLVDSISEPEFILDAFAGAGPFSIAIARNASPRPTKIIAVDLNPHAVEYLRLNIARNRCEGIVEPLEEDAAVVLREMADMPGEERLHRIMMNLPRDAFAYLPAAMNAVRKGGTINYYAIIERENLESHMERIMEVGAEAVKNVDIVFHREVRNYSPSMGHFAFDLVID